MKNGFLISNLGRRPKLQQNSENIAIGIQFAYTNIIYVYIYIYTHIKKLKELKTQKTQKPMLRRIITVQIMELEKNS
jgi:hypothetical protein